MENEVGLALEGGGARGAYEIGAVKLLLEIFLCLWYFNRCYKWGDDCSRGFRQAI